MASATADVPRGELKGDGSSVTVAPPGARSRARRPRRRAASGPCQGVLVATAWIASHNGAIALDRTNASYRAGGDALYGQSKLSESSDRLRRARLAKAIADCRTAVELEPDRFDRVRSARDGARRLALHRPLQARRHPRMPADPRRRDARRRGRTPRRRRRGRAPRRGRSRRGRGRGVRRKHVGCGAAADAERRRGGRRSSGGRCRPRGAGSGV